MMRRYIGALSAGCLMLCALMISGVFGAQDALPPPPLDDSKALTKSLSRGGEIEKLSPELRILFLQFQTARGGRPAQVRYNRAQLKKIFGIIGDSPNPSIEVIIRLIKEAGKSAEQIVIERVGGKVHVRFGENIYATVPVLSLGRLARDGIVLAVDPITVPSVPEPPKPDVERQLGLQGPPLTRGALANAFDQQGLTGKGVIVGLIDTGIDWRHPDFIKADGTSRILYLYDMFDDSWSTSNGRIGQKPPLNNSGTGKPLGTVYTNAQINAALRGRGTINSRDVGGHGTACAGTAAGNGRATANGVPPGTYAGVAPAADLIIVRASEEGSFHGLSYLTAGWIAEQAKTLGKPCVINMSFGSQFSAHDGNRGDEKYIDGLVGPGKPGVAVCIAAGNEKRYSFYSGGKFGPKREGQADTYSPSVELFVSEETTLRGYFDPADDWGVVIQGLDKFFVDASGKPAFCYLYKAAGSFKGSISGAPISPLDFRSWFNSDSVHFSSSRQGEPRDRIDVLLPPGKYLIRGFGASANVKSGRFDFYLPEYYSASFGRGVEKKYMVGSPGNAGNAITVGAYDFRNTWENLDGKWTTYNMDIGRISAYSSPGFRLDGAVKPDITAPATYTISSMAKDCNMSKDRSGQLERDMITRDGYHLAWSGTSAATPYVVGVIALMLEKNPTLDAKQIRDIITRTAKADSFTRAAGQTPNPEWGYGKIDSAAALRATPAAAGGGTNKRK